MNTVRQYSPSTIANAFIWKANQSSQLLSNTKLQKLVFFCHVNSLVKRGSSCVKEKPVVWKYGPVFESLYHALKFLDPKEISNYIRIMRDGETLALVPNQKDVDFYELLDQVWDEHGYKSAAQLSDECHEPGSPWDQTEIYEDISDELIREFYKPA